VHIYTVYDRSENSRTTEYSQQDESTKAIKK